MRELRVYIKHSIKFIKRSWIFGVAFMTSFYMSGQAPTWEYSGNFLNTMTMVMTMSDECVPSADTLDIIGAFDLNGEVRGVAKTNIGKEAYLTIGGTFTGEIILFKVYDASTNEVYNIHNFSMPFASGVQPGADLIFDSSSSNNSGGPDQNLYDVSSTFLEADGVGTWSIISGTGGSFVNASSPTTKFNGVLGTSYLLAWTLSDTQGCIGETDEVKITFIINQPETSMLLCKDGLDNDNDGLVDCADPDCGIPSNISFQKTPPTPIDCNTSSSNGSITINQTGGDVFSIDEGVNTQGSPIFSGLGQGDFNFWIQNTNTGCTTTVTTVLENSLDDLDAMSALKVSGPTVFCSELSEIEYSVIGVPVGKTATWSISGQGNIIVPNFSSSRVTFGSVGSAVHVIAKVVGNCRSISDTLFVAQANPTICTNYSNCVKNIHVDNDLVLSSGIQMFHARESLTADIMFIKDNYQLTAGATIELQPGFSISQGVSVLAEIRGCPIQVNP